jgi:DNA polymerase III epsilon subunit-like protein
MKYISLDVETTGLDPERCQILSIGAIIEDTKNPLPFDDIPKFHCAILHNEITGSPFAINMNRKIVEGISSYQNAKDQGYKDFIEHSRGMKFFPQEEVVKEFYYFLYDNGLVREEDLNKSNYFEGRNGKMYPMITSNVKPVSVNFAGKNFATFDKLFLERLPRWKQVIRPRQRVIDPAILFVDWNLDETLPGLALCKERAKVDGIVTHDALEDAWDVIQILRSFYK